jgi:RNA polymerase sigma-70 factor (family 1)
MTKRYINRLFRAGYNNSFARIKLCLHQSYRQVLKNNILYNEDELTRQIVAGNIIAFEQLFKEMHTALYFLASKLLSNEDLARDLVSDIFLKLWERRASLMHVKNIKAFLYAATRNRSLDHLRKVQYTTAADALADEPDQRHFSYDDFLQAIYDAETIRVLYKAIEGLPPECRKVVELGLEGLSTGEIAKQLDISLSAVSNQKARAIKLLKEKVPLAILVLLFTLLDQAS